MTLPALAAAPVATAMLWPHGPLIALAAAPLAASAAILGLAVLLTRREVAGSVTAAARVSGHFGPEWRSAAHG